MMRKYESTLVKLADARHIVALDELHTDKVWGHGSIEIRFTYLSNDLDDHNWRLHCVRIMCQTRGDAVIVLRKYREYNRQPKPWTADGSLEDACKALRDKARAFTLKWLSRRPCIVEVNDPDNFRVHFFADNSRRHYVPSWLNRRDPVKAARRTFSLFVDWL